MRDSAKMWWQSYAMAIVAARTPEEFFNMSTETDYRFLYTLDENGEPHQEQDLMKWAMWFETFHNRVAVDVVNGLEVSTIYLGVNQRFVGPGPPLLWETMVFAGDGESRYRTQYSRRSEAEAGHKATVERAKNGDFDA
jgi:hypothetical protein